MGSEGRGGGGEGVKEGTGWEELARTWKIISVQSTNKQKTKKYKLINEMNKRRDIHILMKNPLDG